MPDLKQHTLKYHDRDVYYWTQMKKNAPTILIIPGLSGDHTDLSQLGEYLSRDFSVIIPDLPGWGKSKALKGKNTLEKYTDVLSAIIHEQKHENLIVVGHCMGAVLAIELALKHPTYVRQLFLLNPPYEDGKLIFCILKKSAEVSQKFPKRIRPLFFMWQGKRLLFFFSLVTARFRTLSKRFEYAKTKLDKDPSQDIFEENTLGVYEFNWTKLTRIVKPIHILHGECDVIVPPKQVELLLKTIKKHIPVSIIPGAGHLLTMERPGEVARIIRADTND